MTASPTPPTTVRPSPTPIRRTRTARRRVTPARTPTATARSTSASRTSACRSTESRSSGRSARPPAGAAEAPVPAPTPGGRRRRRRRFRGHLANGNAATAVGDGASALTDNNGDHNTATATGVNACDHAGFGSGNTATATGTALLPRPSATTTTPPLPATARVPLPNQTPVASPSTAVCRSLEAGRGRLAAGRLTDKAAVPLCTYFHRLPRRRYGRATRWAPGYSSPRRVFCSVWSPTLTLAHPQQRQLPARGQNGPGSIIYNTACWAVLVDPPSGPGCRTPPPASQVKIWCPREAPMEFRGVRGQDYRVSCAAPIPIRVAPQ